MARVELWTSRAGSNYCTAELQLLQKLLNDNNLPSRAKKHVVINDIILSSVRPANKNINIITTNNFKENLIVSTGFIILRPQKINPNYFV